MTLRDPGLYALRSLDPYHGLGEFRPFNDPGKFKVLSRP